MTTLHREAIEIPTTRGALPGDLTVPAEPIGLVVFAHGSGSSRHSPRNRFVAEHLNEGGLGTLLFDLLTPDEANDRANVFDLHLLATRVLAATSWVRDNPATADLPIGVLGASTGAAAALWASVDDRSIAAVVSRGGRPDLAQARLLDVTAPTLLIVGANDGTVVDLNVFATNELRCEHRLELVPDATHLFEEPGTLERAADLARTWFVEHLGRQSAGT